jgi:type II secretion system protein N
MKKNGKWIAYAAYGIVASILFLYLLFPAERVKEYLIYTAGKHFPDVNVAMETVRLAFPPGLKMKSLTVHRNEQPLLQAPQAHVRPALLSLFRSAKNSYTRSAPLAGY